MTVLQLPFQFGCLISFSYLIVMVRTSTVLDKSGERENPSVVPYLKKNALSFFPLSMMLVLSLSHMAFIIILNLLQSSSDPYQLNFNSI